VCGQPGSYPFASQADANQACLDHGCVGLAASTLMDGGDGLWGQNSTACIASTLRTQDVCTAMWFSDLTTRADWGGGGAPAVTDRGIWFMDTPGQPGCMSDGRAKGWMRWFQVAGAAACVGCADVHVCPPPPSLPPAPPEAPPAPPPSPPSNPPAPPQPPAFPAGSCPWLHGETSGQDYVMVCRDGTRFGIGQSCHGAVGDCCTTRGYRWVCPPNVPVLCAAGNPIGPCGGSANESCCVSAGGGAPCDFGIGERECPVSPPPAPP
jgi:hypothetical protein